MLLLPLHNKLPEYCTLTSFSCFSLLLNKLRYLIQIQKDGDQDMLLGRKNLVGVEYYENIATRADQQPIWSKIHSDRGPFAKLSTFTEHWAPEKSSQAVFYDMDNDGDQDLVLAGIYGTTRYYENVGTVVTGNFVSWDGTSSGDSYKSTSGKNWDYDPFKDVVQTLIFETKNVQRQEEESSLTIYDIDNDGGKRQNIDVCILVYSCSFVD